MKSKRVSQLVTSTLAVAACAAMGVLAPSAAFGDTGVVSASVQVTGSPASTGGTVGYGLTAFSTCNRYMAWRIHTTTPGDVSVDVANGGSDGAGDAAFMGTATSGSGVGGAGDASIQGIVAGQPISLGHDLGEGWGWGTVYPGTDYYVIFILGGGHVPVGGYEVQVSAPPGTTVDAFTSGPSTQFTDMDFAGPQSSPLVVPSVTQSDLHIDGSVSFKANTALFGSFTPGLGSVPPLQSGYPTASLSYTDPSGTTTTASPDSGGFEFYGLPAGTYTLHLQEDLSSPYQISTTALLADVVLP